MRGLSRTLLALFSLFSNRKLAIASFKDLAITSPDREHPLRNRVGTAAGVDCDGDITIANAADAKDVREACTSVGGDVTLQKGIDEDINLDGIKSINGNFDYTGCISDGDRDCPNVGDLWSLSSDSLAFVNQSINIWRPHNLGKILLPKLREVRGEVAMNKLDNVTHLDLTNLEALGGFRLGGPSLQEFKLNRLKRFTRGPVSFTIAEVGEVESLDGLFSNKVEAFDDADHVISLSIDCEESKNLKEMTLAWANLTSASFQGNNLVVTFGNPSVKKMSIGRIDTTAGTTFRRHRDLEQLEVPKVEVDNRYGTVNNTGREILPFDNLSSAVLLEETDLDAMSIELPEQAAKWPKMNLTIDAWNITLRTENNDGDQIWHWPPVMELLEIRARFNNSLL